MTCLHIRFVRSSLEVVVFFIVKSESKRLLGTDFAAEDMKENIQAIICLHSCNFFNIEWLENVPILKISNMNRIFVPSQILIV